MDTCISAFSYFPIISFGPQNLPIICDTQSENLWELLNQSATFQYTFFKA